MIDAYKYFGAQLDIQKHSCTFRVYAPNAKSISVVGDFNSWSSSMHKMEKIDDRGIWEIEIKNVAKWSLYKYNIEKQDGAFHSKSDPYGFFSELRPKSSSIVLDIDDFEFSDQKWMKNRCKNLDKALNIYECHLPSWRLDYNGKWLKMSEIAEQLIPYVKSNGYTHIELLPVNEHPFDASWGYQATGFFAASSRLGDPFELMKFINLAHQNGIGVILDVITNHFVKDEHGLVNFDGTPLYEYSNPHDAENQWGSLNFDLWREEVRSFLISSYAFWLDKYHFDGLRFDAVANLIHWGGDRNRGENEGALFFIKRCNHLIAEKFPNVMLIAEDSSDYQGVTKPSFENGLGFDYKWDLGWMNDTLKYFGIDPINRKYHHNLITFSMLYFYSEKFILPLSHDEVVHMKGSILNKMWGTYEQKMMQIKTLMAYMFSHPGKKLNFMGNDIATSKEWDEAQAINFEILKYPMHVSYLRFFKDLSEVYKTHKAFHENEYSRDSHRWIDADNNKQSVFSYIRRSVDEEIVVVLNMCPVSYESFKIGVEKKGKYIELINSEKDIYSGCNMCNFEILETENEKMHNLPYSLDIRLAPFSSIYFKLIDQKQENDNKAKSFCELADNIKESEVKTNSKIRKTKRKIARKKD